MQRLGLLLLVLLMVACTDKKKGDEKPLSAVFSLDSFSSRFAAASLPYTLSDSVLQKNKDTAAVHDSVFIRLLPDSITQKIFTKGAKIKYIPLVKVVVPTDESYFIVKATSGSRSAALIMYFDRKKMFRAALPFLIPDADPATSQVSVLDKSRSVSRNVSRKSPEDVLVEGKDVYAYDTATHQFALIMTDLLDESSAEIVNPIDTLSRHHSLAGDYGADKKNMVSIRDARAPGELSFFIHFDRDNGECRGELKGVALLTSTKTAVYRQGGDPCVLEFYFTPASVRLKEVEGCGSHRGVRCIIEGTFTRKKEPKLKSTSRKSGRK